MFEPLFNLTFHRWEIVLLSLLPALINLFLFLYVRIFFPDYSVSKIFSLFLLSLVLWQLNDSFVRMSCTVETAMLWNNIFAVGWLFFAPLGLHFTLYYTGNKKIARSFTIQFLLYFPFLVFFIMNFLYQGKNIFIRSDTWGWAAFLDPWSHWAAEGYLISLESFIILALLVRYSLSHAPNDIRRKQAMIIAIGFFIPQVQGIATEVVLPSFTSYPAVPLTSSVMTCFSFATLLALKKFELFKASESLQLRTILETLSETLMVLSPKGQLKFINKEGEKMLGLDFKKERNFDLNTVFPDIKHAEHFSRELLEPVSQGRKISNYSTEFIAPGNRKIPVLISATSFKISHSETDVLLLVKDVTSRRQVLESLHKSEANLRSILENTDTAYVLLNTKADILSYNRLANELAVEQFGRPLEEGKNYINLMLEERRWEVRNIINQVLIKKEQISYEVKYAGRGKADKWLYVRMHPILNDVNGILGLSVAATNITGKKFVEEQLRQSNERYELATKATNDVIWDWDIINNRIYRSENYKQVFGHYQNEDDRYVKPYKTDIHPDDHQRIRDSLLEKINDPDSLSWENEYRVYRNNGELAYVHDRGYIIRNEEKRPVRMVGAMRDITKEKLLALEREKITSELVQRNKDLEQFAYIISHNLRAPVANVLGLSTIIRNAQLGEEDLKNGMDALVLSVKKLDDVIMDLNHILQVRQEKDEKKETVHFSDLVDDIRANLRDLIQKENVTIITNFADTNELFTLKSYMNSIFYNLISNSIKYQSAREAPVINITSKKINGSKVMLNFSDNGLGIDLAAQGNKVFGLYNRFHFHKEGKGMGLYMVKTQVEILGGKISIKSEPDKGTEFSIELKT